MSIVLTMKYGRETVGNFLRKAGDGLGYVDDKVQGAARYMYGERDGQPISGDGPFTLGRSLMANIMHRDRSRYDDNWQGKVSMIGSRAFQAGSLTAAGVGLANLTNTLNQQTDGTIEMN